MIDLTGKVAFVSGGSRGIGRACVLKFAEAGADVIINYVTSHGAAMDLAERVDALGRKAYVVKADVREEDDVKTMMEWVGNEIGQLDILVSNAATGGFRPLLQASIRNFHAAMETNVMALIYLAQAAVPLLEKSAGRGKIIGISSHGSHKALPMYGLIGGSKAALEAIVRHLTLEVGHRNINVNVVQAGLVSTDSTRLIPHADEIFARRTEKTMMGERNLELEDVANAVLFLASPMADMVQGATLIVDGGANVHI